MGGINPLQNFEKILELQDLHQNVLRPDIYREYTVIIFKAAIDVFHEATIDAYLTRHNYREHVQNALLCAMTCKNINSFKYIYDKYGNGELSCIDTLSANSLDEFAIDVIKHISRCQKISQKTKNKILDRICTFNKKNKLLGKVIELLLPKLEINCENILGQIMSYCDMQAFKAFISNVNFEYCSRDQIIYITMLDGTKQQLEYLCSIPKFGSAYLEYLSKQTQLEPPDYYMTSGISVSAYLFTFVYDQKYLSDIGNFYFTHDDRDVDQMIMVSYWIRSKRELYRLYAISRISNRHTIPKTLTNTINQFMVRKSNFKTDVKYNLLKRILKPNSLYIQFTLFD
jgi:hypothetical protein